MKKVNSLELERIKQSELINTLNHDNYQLKNNYEFVKQELDRIKSSDIICDKEQIVKSMADLENKIVSNSKTVGEDKLTEISKKLFTDYFNDICNSTNKNPSAPFANLC